MADNIIQMRLNPAPFDMISSGQKTIELRLCDEKRRLIKKGDVIIFTNSEDPSQILTARVTELHKFASFTELYEALPLDKCGYRETELDTAKPFDMDEYYSREEQMKYGVIGIEIELISE